MRTSVRTPKPLRLPQSTFLLWTTVLVGTLSLLMSSTLEAQTQVKRVRPNKIFLEAGGRQVNIMMEGSNLHLLKSIAVTQEGYSVKKIYARMGVKKSTLRGVALVAAPDVTIGEGYSIAVKTKNGPLLDVPVEIIVVEAGDERADRHHGESFEETVLQGEGESNAIIPHGLAPEVTSVEPSPLRLLPNGETQTFEIRGVNLERIDDVRVRKADADPKYRGRKGKVPFRYREVDGVIEVPMRATARTQMGAQFKMDFLIKGFLAMSVPFSIGDPKAPVITPAGTTDNSRLIELPLHLVQPMEEPGESGSHEGRIIRRAVPVEEVDSPIVEQRDPAEEQE